MINKILLITFIMFLPFALLSCGGDTTSVTDTVANANAKKRSKKKEVKKEVAKEVFGPGNERNIFVSYLAMEEEAIDETPRGPLEHFDLGVLHLKAVLRAGDSVTALIASPDGKTHRANAGDRIGLDRGVIKRVERGKLIITVPNTNEYGEVIGEKDVELLMPERFK